MKYFEATAITYLTEGAANWYNKRYNKYGYCIPPELLIKFKEEDHEASC